MSSGMFIDDVIKPVLFLFAFGLISFTWGLAIWKYLQEMHRTKQQKSPQEEIQPLLPEHYAVDATERLIEMYWQAWEEQVKDD